MRLRLAAFSTVLIGLFLLTAFAQAQSTSDIATSRPFQKELTCDMAVGGNSCSAEFTVPANSRLKLTYVNVRAALAPTGTQRAIAQFNTIFQQKQVNYAIPLSRRLPILPGRDDVSTTADARPPVSPYRLHSSRSDRRSPSTQLLDFDRQGPNASRTSHLRAASLPPLLTIM
jgi:hypothetical protein